MGHRPRPELVLRRNLPCLNSPAHPGRPDRASRCGRWSSAPEPSSGTCSSPSSSASSCPARSSARTSPPSCRSSAAGTCTNERHHHDPFPRPHRRRPRRRRLAGPPARLRARHAAQAGRRAHRDHRPVPRAGHHPEHPQEAAGAGTLARSRPGRGPGRGRGPGGGEPEDGTPGRVQEARTSRCPSARPSCGPGSPWACSSRPRPWFTAWSCRSAWALLADAALTFLLIVALAVVLAELTRRHHRTVAPPRRARCQRPAPGTPGGTAGPCSAWLAAKAGPRWENREHRPLMFRRLRGEPEGPASAEPAAARALRGPRTRSGRADQPSALARG